MNRSPLHDLNGELGARFVDFAGWEMPVQFQSVLDEHRSVRTGAGWFDVSHLGRFELSGAGTRNALRRLLCNDIDLISPGRCQYSLALNSDGGIVDDLLVWWWEDERFWVLPNAANHETIMSMFAGEDGCHVKDLRADTVMIAVQGPGASELFEEVLGAKPGRYRTASVQWEGSHLSLAGTGYTGEAGGEICTDPETANTLVKVLTEGGAKPCGLGARDTLRLEAGLALWGSDIDQGTTPLEAGLDFAVSYDHEFVGRARLEEQKQAGVARKLAGFILEGKGIPRHGYRIRSAGGGEGSVTSGNISPMLGVGIGLGYLSPPPEAGETGLEVEIRGRWVEGRIATPPFHKS